MKGTLNKDGNNTLTFAHLPGMESHYWGSNTVLRSHAITKAMDEIVSTLSDAGIDIEQWHAESATGQFEFVLPACTPLEAADALV